MLFSGQIAKRIERELTDPRVDDFIRWATHNQFGKADLLWGMQVRGDTFTDVAKLSRTARRELLAQFTDFTTTTEAFDAWERYKQDN